VRVAVRGLLRFSPFVLVVALLFLLLALLRRGLGAPLDQILRLRPPFVPDDDADADDLVDVGDGARGGGRGDDGGPRGGG
jgi:hypothetical protein